MNELNKIIETAKDMQDQLVYYRRTLHKHPEIGFDLTFTKKFVYDALCEMGYTPKEVGKAGIVVTLGQNKPGTKCILLRADMDALAIKEEAEVTYKSENEGAMHGCGHDMHTAMLLGAAKLLKNYENKIEGTVKLCFQPAEEIFQGSLDMIKQGLLSDPKVDAAFMIHVIAGQQLPSGTFLVSGGGVATASCEQYHITVQGKGGHGSMPNLAIDPITAACQIHLALMEINARELDGNDYGVFTTGRFEAGKTSNVIPDTAQMWGTIRTVDRDNKVGEYIKKRIKEITSGVGTALRCETKVEFFDYCPSMMIDENLAKEGLCLFQKMFPKSCIDMKQITLGKPGGGSEDFAFVSHKVPVLSVFLSAGGLQEGYLYGQHHPKVIFNDDVLYLGTAAYVGMALSYLEEK